WYAGVVSRNLKGTNALRDRETRVSIAPSARSNFRRPAIKNIEDTSMIIQRLACALATAGALITTSAAQTPRSPWPERQSRSARGGQDVDVMHHHPAAASAGQCRLAGKAGCDRCACTVAPDFSGMLKSVASTFRLGARLGLCSVPITVILGSRVRGKGNVSRGT